MTLKQGQFIVSAPKGGVMSPALNIVHCFLSLTNLTILFFSVFQSWYTQECANLFGSPFEAGALQNTIVRYGSNVSTLLTASNVIYVTSPSDAFASLQLWYVSNDYVRARAPLTLRCRKGDESSKTFPNQHLFVLDSGTYICNFLLLCG